MTRAQIIASTKVGAAKAAMERQGTVAEVAKYRVRLKELQLKAARDEERSEKRRATA